ncbi:crotonase/enoyl-CoA hydratase family protein [Colwelliaceae bacterium 6471]
MRIHCKIVDQIAHVKLSRAEKHNALDMKMFYAIDKTIKDLKRNRDVRAIIISGDGPDFCSGLDVKSIMTSKTSPIKLLFKFLPWHSNLAQRVSTAWQTIPAPVIAAIHGRCWGGGLQIALGADIRIACPNASLSILEGRWGLIPDMGGTLALRELTRLDVAKELAMTAAFVDGKHAQTLGLVTHLDDDPVAKAQQLAETMLSQSPDAIAAVKKLYNKSWRSSAALALLRESYYQIKILLGKNSKIKTYNQTHAEDKKRSFVSRQRW